MTGRSLLDLMDVHSRIDELFDVHRDRVVELRFSEALSALERFEAALLEHMTDEDEAVLPLYVERVGHVVGGDPEFFRLEHKNLKRNLSSIKEALRELAADPRAGVREAHRFLETEHLFLHLLEHHSLREKNILYPCLDRALSEEERGALLRRCHVKKDPT